MVYRNNHYVPQLVLRRYNTEKLTVYDIKTGEVHKDMKLNEIFAEQDLYGEEIEISLSKNIESSFAQILNQKILPAEVGSEIELTRKELYIIKKFLLIEQMRIFQADKEEWYKFSQHVSDWMSKLYNFPFREVKKENETVKDRWLRTLRVLLESKDFTHVQNHEMCTNEAYYWALIYHSGYLAIWDCTGTGEEFIITDIGMTSEREKGAPIGLEVQKKLYLKEIYERAKSKRQKDLYAKLSFQQQFFHENFYMFSISKTRMLVIINPFFRLYDKSERVVKPYIWPSLIEGRELFKKNRMPDLKADSKGYPILSDEDLFGYTVHPMLLEDFRWVNILMLDRVQNILGFSDIEKIADSVCDYKEFYDNVLKRPMMVDYDPLIKYFKDNGIID